MQAPQGGAEEKYYCALGYGRDVNRMGTREWDLMNYSSSSVTGGQKHTHTVITIMKKDNLILRKTVR